MTGVYVTQQEILGSESWKHLLRKSPEKTLKEKYMEQQKKLLQEIFSE